ncbi:ASC-1 homology (ASCH) domain-containing protein [Clostridium sp. DSM 8431]|uniref:ASCH domain-containing protein n=1 Tax=Clostridium sp. DSM 8431 TaxID=1761781 RepID=UPI0008EEA1D9|nr:ASCH domain-containing protein [Clostridium sp. DSM 8431]SFU78389.1 ASC-1 homology (ASCH) domain-containing protein [Clostridium sp. DSM 8431]
MIHKMKLQEKEFNNIKYNNKVIEVRLNDEKRKKIKKKDEIIFYKQPLLKETISVIVKDVYRTKKFYDIYSKYKSDKFGYPNKDTEDMLKIIYSIYSREQEAEEGVVAIQFEVKNQ